MTRTEKSAERLRTAREARKMSYQDLSNITGYSKSVLQRYETGNIEKMPINRIEVIASALCVDAEWLMGFGDKDYETASASYALSSDERLIVDTYRAADPIGRGNIMRVVMDTHDQIEKNAMAKNPSSKTG